MATSAVAYRAFAIGLALAIFGGCGAQSAGTLPQGISAQNRAHTGSGSWMLPEASSDDLLYASDDATNQIFVFSYPEGTHVGTLTGFYEPGGLCADNAGNVWITNVNPFEVIEYAHGGTTPIATLTTKYKPFGCAVDPTTGNLAVVTGFSTIVVFPNGENPPISYRNTKFQGLFYGSYDDTGNFFSQGLFKKKNSRKQVLAELPRDGTKIIPVFIKHRMGGSVVQWDGEYLAVGGENYGYYSPVPVRQVEVSGNRGTVVHTVWLKNRFRSLTWQQFWIQGTNIIQPYNNDKYLGIWPYPQGGYPTSTISIGHGHNFCGVTVSVAPSK